MRRQDGIGGANSYDRAYVSIHPMAQQPRPGALLDTPSLRGWAQRCAQRGEALWTFVDSYVRGLHGAPVVQQCLGDGCHVQGVPHQDRTCRRPALEIAQEHTTAFPNVAYSAPGYPPRADYDSNVCAKSASCPQNHAVSCLR